MITIAICDDEKQILMDLQTRMEIILRKHKITYHLDLYDSAKKFKNIYEKDQPDLLFLDIDMPEQSGMDLAKELQFAKGKTLFSFVTNYEALVYQSFACHPFAFLRKDHLQEELEEVLLRMIDSITAKKQDYTFQQGGISTTIEITDILYFEADANYVKLVTDEEVYRIRETLSHLNELFQEKFFLRIHKGFLLNMNKVFVVRQEEVELINHMILPIGRTNREAVKQELFRFIRGMSI